MTPEREEEQIGIEHQWRLERERREAWDRYAAAYASTWVDDSRAFADMAADMADAMLAERDKRFKEEMK